MRKININNNFSDVLKYGKFKLVPFVLAASMLSGCGVRMKSVEPVKSSCISNSLNDIGDFLEEQNRLATYFSNWGYNCQDIGDNFYRVKEDYNQNIFYCDSLDEFRNYVDIKNPTYDDVRCAVIENPSFKGEYETWLLEGLDNLEKASLNLDLVALYQNIKRMSIVSQTIDEIVSEIGSPGAYFSIEDGKVFLNPETVTPYTLCHEVLGHGISDIQIEKDGRLIFYKPDFLLLYADIDNADYYFKYTGFSLEEGKADFISDIATGIKSGGPYDVEAEQLRIFIETIDISLSDYIKYGTSYLVKTMRENDIDRPIDYIMAVDELLTGQREKNFNIPNNFLMEHNIVEFFKDYADDKINAGVSNTVIKDKVQGVLENTSYDFVTAGEFFIYDSVDMDKLQKRVLSEVDNLQEISKKSR